MKRHLMVLTAASAGLLAGCSKLTPPSDTSPALSIEGTVSAPELPSTLSYVPTNGSASVTTTVNSDGTFSLPLPLELTSDALSQPSTALGATGCTGTVNSTEGNARNAALFSLTDGKRSFVSGTTLKSTIPPRVDLMLEGLVYSNVATQITGQLDCGPLLNLGKPVPVSVALPLAKGWNRVNLTLSGRLELNGSISASGSLNVGGSPTTRWQTMQDLTASLKLF